MTQRILCVDDERNVLDGFQRQLRKRYALETTCDAHDGLKIIQERGPFAVVVSDMRMPAMDGVQFLTRVREIAPDTVRMMLTGNADQQTAAHAVNEGCIFRFLNKPCSPEAFAKALDAGLDQYRLIRTERELLSSTLNGSVKLLTEILALVNPTAFGRAEGIHRMVNQLCQVLPVSNAWEIKLAAMLSQVGCVAVPEEVLNKVAKCEKVSESERQLYDRHPRVGSELIAKIPRLEGVARIVADQLGRTADATDDYEVPYGSRVLRAVLDYDQLLSAGKTSEDALVALQARPGAYETRILDAFSTILHAGYVIRCVNVAQLEDGMIFDEHVQTLNDGLLVAKGSEVAACIRERLAVLAKSPFPGVRQPIRVRCAPLSHSG